MTNKKKCTIYFDSQSHVVLVFDHLCSKTKRIWKRKGKKTQQNQVNNYDIHAFRDRSTVSILNSNDDHKSLVLLS